MIPYRPIHAKFFNSKKGGGIILFTSTNTLISYYIKMLKIAFLFLVPTHKSIFRGRMAIFFILRPDKPLKKTIFFIEVM